MKNAIFVVLIISIVLSSCVMESSGFQYHFIIKNRTNQTIVIKSQTLKYNEFNSDTIKPYSQLDKIIARTGCFKDLGDSLIKSNFKKLYIQTASKSINLDPFKTENWKDSSELSGIICKGGNAFFILELKEIDFK